MAKILLGTTIICGSGWVFTYFLCMTMICYLKREGATPRKEDLKDCAQSVLRRFFKIEK